VSYPVSVWEADGRVDARYWPTAINLGQKDGNSAPPAGVLCLVAG
jgi:hypothetical protein